MRRGDASITPLADIARLLVDEGGHPVPTGSAAQVVRQRSCRAAATASTS
jgi:hypothetical protein